MYIFVILTHALEHLQTLCGQRPLRSRFEVFTYILVDSLCTSSLRVLLLSDHRTVLLWQGCRATECSTTTQMSKPGRARRYVPWFAFIQGERRHLTMEDNGAPHLSSFAPTDTRHNISKLQLTLCYLALRSDSMFLMKGSTHLKH